MAIAQEGGAPCWIPLVIENKLGGPPPNSVTMSNIVEGYHYTQPGVRLSEYDAVTKDPPTSSMKIKVNGTWYTLPLDINNTPLQNYSINSTYSITGSVLKYFPKINIPTASKVLKVGGEMEYNRDGYNIGIGPSMYCKDSVEIIRDDGVRPIIKKTVGLCSNNNDLNYIPYNRIFGMFADEDEFVFTQLKARFKHYSPNGSYIDYSPVETFMYVPKVKLHSRTFNKPTCYGDKDGSITYSIHEDDVYSKSTDLFNLYVDVYGEGSGAKIPPANQPGSPPASHNFNGAGTLYWHNTVLVEGEVSFNYNDLNVVGSTANNNKNGYKIESLPAGGYRFRLEQRIYSPLNNSQEVSMYAHEEFFYIPNPKKVKGKVDKLDSWGSEDINIKSCESVGRVKIQGEVGEGTFKYTTGYKENPSTKIISSSHNEFGAGNHRIFIVDGNNCRSDEYSITMNAVSQPIIFPSIVPKDIKCHYGQTNTVRDTLGEFTIEPISGGLSNYDITLKNGGAVIDEDIGNDGTTGLTFDNIVYKPDGYIIRITDATGCWKEESSSLTRLNALSTSLTETTPAKCNDLKGSAKISISGGKVSGSYTIDNLPTGANFDGSSTINNLPH
ncbi:MAG: hypothetical protein MI922_00500, partial [Bacteroidales bacterium]|nr:hypothetical protein [Bacteroidales bacterium]